MLLGCKLYIACHGNTSTAGMSILGKVTPLTGRSIDDGKSCEEWVNTDYEWKNLKPVYHQNT